MFDLLSSLAQSQSGGATMGFFAVAVSGITLMPIACMLLSGVFCEKTEWTVPQEAYRPRHKRELI